MVRNIAAGIVGLIVAAAIVQLVQVLGHSVYPTPDNIDLSDPEQVEVLMTTLPVGAVLFVGASWALGAFAGTLVGAIIATAKPLIYAIVVGGFVLGAAVIVLIVMPHPWWFSISAPLAIVVGAYLGMSLGVGLRRGS